MSKFSLLIAALAVAVTFCACSKKEDDAAIEGQATGQAVEAKPLEEVPDKEQIPGENSVRQALKQKEYSAAVERYTALKAAVATPEQQDAYMALYGQLRSELEEAAPSDPKAAEALAMFRLLRNGR